MIPTKQYLLTLILLISMSVFYLQAHAQISVKTIAYWDLNESYDFYGSYQRYQVTNGDTIYSNDVTYDITVKVIDSTATSYDVLWKYSNFDIKTGDALIQAKYADIDSVSLVIRTDELGTYESLIEWQELTAMYQSIQALQNQNDEGLTLGEEIKSSIISSNEIDTSFLESNAMHDIIAYLNFHGAQYDLGERYEGIEELRNNLGGDPFKTEFQVWLSDIDSEEYNYIMRSYSAVDTTTLTDATYEYLKGLAALSEDDFPEREDFPAVSNETYISNRIHSSGWVTYSIYTREVQAQDIITIEEYIIGMK